MASENLDAAERPHLLSVREGPPSVFQAIGLDQVFQESQPQDVSQLESFSELQNHWGALQHPRQLAGTCTVHPQPPIGWWKMYPGKDNEMKCLLSMLICKRANFNIPKSTRKYLVVEVGCSRTLWGCYFDVLTVNSTYAVGKMPSALEAISNILPLCCAWRLQCMTHLVTNCSVGYGAKQHVVDMITCNRQEVIQSTFMYTSFMVSHRDVQVSRMASRAVSNPTRYAMATSLRSIPDDRYLIWLDRIVKCNAFPVAARCKIAEDY